MTATEELRRLLDERGVKWTDFRDQRCVTAWMEPAGAVRADEYDAGLLLVERVMTPEQAVAATLGPGTCEVEEYEDTGILVCSECGAVQPEDHTVYYCWCCGAKVVSGDGEE